MTTLIQNRFRQLVFMALFLGFTPTPVARALISQPGASAAQPSKAQILERLKSMQTHQTEEIRKLEDTVKKRLQESTALTLKDDPRFDGRKISLLADQIAELDKKRSERIARRAFLDQMILVVDSKYTGQPLNGFLQGQLLDMASTDLTNPQGSTQPWRFYTYLSIAIREATEPHEDVMNVMESYLNFAGVLSPKTPAEFLEGRNFTNPDASYTARKVDRATLGDSVGDSVGASVGDSADKSAKTKKNPRPADIELHMSASPGP